MNLIRSISPAHAPDRVAAQGQTAIYRERILQTLLVMAAIATLIGYAILAARMVANRQYVQLLQYTGLTVVLLAFIAYRKMPYFLRAGIVLVVAFAATLLSFADAGSQGDGKLYLLAFLAMSTVLLGWKTGLAFWLVSCLAYAGLGYGIFYRQILLPPFAASLASVPPSEWLNTGLSMAILSAITLVALSRLIVTLEASFNQANQLAQDLTRERAGFQERVNRQTDEISQRMSQISIAGEISRTIVALRDPQLLLPRICQLIRDRFGFYYVGAFLVDDHQQAVLKAGTGEAGQKMVAANHALPVGSSSMIGWAIANRQARVALDAGTEAIRFNNPDLPETQSELALPLLSRGDCLGALSIQSERADAFGEDVIQILQGIADSLAIALENSRLLLQTQSSLDEVRALNQNYLQQAWIETTNEYGNLSYTYENQETNNVQAGKWVQVPLTLREQVIGQISLEMETSSLTPDQLEYIDVVSSQTALALENARLLQETQRRASLEQALNNMTVDFSHAVNIDDILKSALQQLSQLPAVSDVTVQVMPMGKPSPITAPSPSSVKSNGNGRGQPA